MQKKEDKVGNETVYKEGRQRKKIHRARLRKIEIDPKKKFQFWFVRFCEKKNVHSNFSV